MRVTVDFRTGLSYRVFVDPSEVHVAHSLEQVLPALRALEDASGRGLFAAGYICYEAAPAFDPAFVVPGQIQTAAAHLRHPSTLRVSRLKARAGLSID